MATIDGYSLGFAKPGGRGLAANRSRRERMMGPAAVARQRATAFVKRWREFNLERPSRTFLLSQGARTAAMEGFTAAASKRVFRDTFAAEVAAKTGLKR